jgi:hypothetical protein
MSNLKQTGQIERGISDIDVYEHVGEGVQTYRPPKQVDGRQRAARRRQVDLRTPKRHLSRPGSLSK